MIKNIVFDLGGVVIDWNPEKVKKESTGNPALPEFLFTSGFFHTFWTAFDRGDLTLRELTKEMASQSGFPLEECIEFVEFIKNSLIDIPETIALINRLSEKGYKLYCLSNMSVEFYDYLKEREVFNLFDGQVISALIHMVKPEKDIYNHLLETYNLNPSTTLFIDDLEANINTAKELGFNTVLFSNREKGYKEIDKLLNSDI